MTLASAFNYFANSLWQVPLLAFCCWCALRLARASARTRYAAWIATLLLCVALPLRGALLQDEGNITVLTGDAFATGAQAQPPTRLPFYAITVSPRTRDVLAEFYLALAALLLIRLIFSYAAQRKLIQRALPPSAQQAITLQAFGADPGRVRLLPACSGTPMVAGIWAAKVLLPEHLLAGDQDTLRAVLAHEFAHLQRRDPVVNLLLRLVALPVAYHPGTVLIQRQIQHARELLCDAEAAKSLPSTHAYAHALLHLAREVFVAGSPAPRSAIGLFERTSKPLLEERIMTLIAPPAPLAAGSRWLRATAGLAVFCAATATVSCVHLTPSVMAAEHQATAPLAASPAQTTADPLPAIAVAEQHKRTTNKPATDAIEQANASLAKAQTQLEFVDTAQIAKQMATLRAHLNSPEFKEQLRAAPQLERKAYANEITQAKKELATVQEQINSPELRRQIAEAQSLSQVDMQKLIADAKEESIRAHETLTVDARPLQGPARVSGGVMAGSIVTKVQPVYPSDAKSAHITGSVIMHAIIGTDGAISSLEVISGPAELRDSALEAVRQWIYKPYLLNGVPTEVDTTITVNYSMG